MPPPPAPPPLCSRKKLEAAAQQQRPTVRIWIEEVDLAPGDIITSQDAVQRAARYMKQELQKVGSAVEPELRYLGKALEALQEFVTQAPPPAGAARRCAAPGGGGRLQPWRDDPPGLWQLGYF